MQLIRIPFYFLENICIIYYILITFGATFIKFCQKLHLIINEK